MAGYVNYSMSRNAVAAYQTGEMSASKFAKMLNKKYGIKGLAAADVKELCDYSSWHHTSKKYNKTYFYDEVCLDEEDLRKLYNRGVIRKRVNKMKRFGLLSKTEPFTVKMKQGGEIQEWHPVYPKDYYREVNFLRIIQTIREGYSDNNLDDDFCKEEGLLTKDEIYSEVLC